DLQDQRMVMLEETAEIGGGGADDLGEILAGAEPAAGAGQQERAAGLVGFGLVERGGERRRHFDRQRIQSLRPVQRNAAIPGAALDENGHVRDPLCAQAQPTTLPRPGESRDPPGRRMLFFVYILASQPHGTLYVGSTPDLIRRICEHKTKVIPSFTAKYSVDQLICFEAHASMAAAAKRDGKIKEQNP